jgi:hypothetical protein
VILNEENDMNFGARAFFPPQKHPIYSTHKITFKEGRGATLPFLNFKCNI